jgi:hypothetical protein
VTNECPMCKKKFTRVTEDVADAAAGVPTEYFKNGKPKPKKLPKGKSQTVRNRTQRVDYSETGFALSQVRNNHAGMAAAGGLGQLLVGSALGSASLQDMFAQMIRAFEPDDDDSDSDHEGSYFPPGPFNDYLVRAGYGRPVRARPTARAPAPVQRGRGDVIDLVSSDEEDRPAAPVRRGAGAAGAYSGARARASASASASLPASMQNYFLPRTAGGGSVEVDFVDLTDDADPGSVAAASSSSSSSSSSSTVALVAASSASSATASAVATASPAVITRPSTVARAAGVVTAAAAAATATATSRAKTPTAADAATATAAAAATSRANALTAVAATSTATAATTASAATNGKRPAEPEKNAPPVRKKPRTFHRSLDTESSESESDGEDLLVANFGLVERPSCLGDTDF